METGTEGMVKVIVLTGGGQKVEHVRIRPGQSIKQTLNCCALLKGVERYNVTVESANGEKDTFSNMLSLDNAAVHLGETLYVTPQESGVLDAQCDPSVPLILGDASQLRQVIHNLVQNGLDAVADQDDGHVRVSTEVARTDNGAISAVRLKVVDNGPGFADKVLKRAFEPYVTTKSKGTGLGLAVVKKIAEEHGARLRVGNLSEGDISRGVSRGAQVSLSFSKLAPSEGMPAMAADDHQAAAAR